MASEQEREREDARERTNEAQLAGVVEGVGRIGFDEGAALQQQLDAVCVALASTNASGASVVNEHEAEAPSHQPARRPGQQARQQQASKQAGRKQARCSAYMKRDNVQQRIVGLGLENQVDVAAGIEVLAKDPHIAILAGIDELIE